MDAYLRLFAFVRPYRARVALAVLATLVLAGASALYAFLIGPLLKLLLSGDAPAAVPLLGQLSREELLSKLPLLLVGAAVVRSAAQALQTFLMQSAGQRVVADVRRALYRGYLGLSQSFLQTSHTGDLLSRFGADVQSIEFALTFAFSSYVKDTLQILTLLGVCATLDARLLAIALIAVPLAAWPIALFARRLKEVADDGQVALGTLTSRVGEAVANVRVVQAFAREEHELARLDAEQERYLAVMRRSFLLRAAFTPVLELLGVFGLAATIYFAGTAIASGALTGEALLSFLAALMLMYQPVKALSSTGQQVIAGLAASRRLFEILDLPRSPADQAVPVQARFERELRLQGVSFSYGQDRRVLDDVSLAVPKGKTLALVGPSGSGKSTLGALLLRFHDPTAGQILLDGVDARSLELAGLRRLIAYVPQEAVLFAGSVRDNVTCVRPSASEAQLEAALAAANALDFVKALEGGLDAAVGERGAKLSGGQRQRLALARAFLSDAPILVLDEATSALDAASEAAVQEGLARLLKDRTAIVIAHRLSTIERADEIAVLSDGRILEQGTHAALLAKGGAYAALAGAGEAPARSA